MTWLSCNEQVRVLDTGSFAYNSKKSNRTGGSRFDSLHSPALRLGGELLVESQGEAKEGAAVPQLVQRVRSLQVKAPHRAAAEAGQQSAQGETPVGKTSHHRPGHFASVSHRGCHAED